MYYTTSMHITGGSSRPTATAVAPASNNSNQMRSNGATANNDDTIHDDNNNSISYRNYNNSVRSNSRSNGTIMNVESLQVEVSNNDSYIHVTAYIVNYSCVYGMALCCMQIESSVRTYSQYTRTFVF
jgi:hypothetical protein